MACALVAFLVGMTFPLPASFGEEANPIPDPAQLVALVQASRARYKSFDVSFEVERHQQVDGKWRDKPDGTAKRAFRSTSDRSYSRAEVTETDAESGVPYVMTVTQAFSPTWSKELQEEKNTTPRATVARGEAMKDKLELDVAGALWSAYGDDVWLNTTNSNATVNRDDSTGNLVLRSKWQDANSMVITIDPAKGYLPIRTEFCGPDGSIVMWCECADFRKTADGLWIPFRYTAELTAAPKTRSTFKLTSAAVNTELSNDQLDFPFPAGTIVNDAITGSRYTVDSRERVKRVLGGPDFAAPRQGPSLRGVGSIAEAGAAEPATEAKLAAVAAAAGVEGPPQRSNTVGWITAASAALFVLLAAACARYFRLRSAIPPR